jgi:hypothetical protein
MAHPKTFHYLRAHTMVEKLLDPTYRKNKILYIIWLHVLNPDT